MNDFSEVRYGGECVNYLLSGETRSKLASVFRSIGYSERLIDFMDDERNRIMREIYPNLYVTCLSEHRPKKEDSYGRLSMWRAYGRNAGVALVLRGSFIGYENTSPGLYSEAVNYASFSDFHINCGIVFNNMLQNSDFLKSIGEEGMEDALSLFLSGSMMYTKHPAFFEEKEWRISTVRSTATAPILQNSIKTVDGIPQTILEIPLVKQDGVKAGDWSIENLLYRIIIGPSAFPFVIRDTLVEALASAGVEHPSSRVWISHIPLRV